MRQESKWSRKGKVYIDDANKGGELQDTNISASLHAARQSADVNAHMEDKFMQHIAGDDSGQRDGLPEVEQPRELNTG